MKIKAKSPDLVLMFSDEEALQVELPALTLALKTLDFYAYKGNYERIGEGSVMDVDQGALAVGVFLELRKMGINIKDYCNDCNKDEPKG